MAMLAAADIMPQRNGRRQAVNKQRYCCTSTEDVSVCQQCHLDYF